MKELLIALFLNSPSPTIQQKEPCNTDFTLLKLETRIKLGVACSAVNGRYVVWSYDSRMEILESDKRI